MTDARIISVNPAEKSMGEKLLNQRYLGNITRYIADTTCPIRFNAGRCIDLFFGLNKKTGMQLSGKMLLLRIICGVGLIVSVLLPMHYEDVLMFDFNIQQLVVIALGFSIFFGLFTRICSIFAMGFLGYTIYGSVIAGTPDSMLVLYMLVSMGFWTLGPGMFSFDQLIRYALRAIGVRLSNSNGKSRSRSLDYQAYVSVDGRVL